MNEDVGKVIEDINVQLESLELEEETFLRKAKKAIVLLKEIMQQLKGKLLDYRFVNEEEEIRFFKELKPQLSSKLVYYSEIYKIETKRPTGSDLTQKNYILDELDKIKDYFDNNLDFYQYYRAERTHLDRFYFLRREPDFEFSVDYFYFERDNNFSSCNDFKVAKVLANELLRIYLNAELHKLEKQHEEDRTIQKFPRVKQTWTGSKTELVELIYSIHTKGSINHGNIDIKELVDYFCNVFNTDAGDYYRTYLNIRSRKESRTIYLDSLRENFIKKMDSDDNK
jgi:hypothetical protein